MACDQTFMFDPSVTSMCKLISENNDGDMNVEDLTNDECCNAGFASNDMVEKE